MGDIYTEETIVRPHSLHQGSGYFTDNHLLEGVFPQSLQGEEPGLDRSESEARKDAVPLRAAHAPDPNMEREGAGKFNSPRLPEGAGMLA